MFCIHPKKQVCIFFLLLLMACTSTDTTVVPENLPTSTPSATATATPIPITPTSPATRIAEASPTPLPPSPIIAQLSHLQEPVRHIVSRPSEFAEPYLPDSNPNIGRDIALLNGRLWFASIAGLLAIDTTTNESQPYTTANGLPDNTIYELETCGAEQLFVGSETGLSLYNSQTDRFESGEAVGFPDVVKIEDMVCQNGRLTIAHDTLTVLNLNSNERTDYNQPTQHILWADEEIWLTTASNGLLRILPDGTTEVYNQAQGNLPDEHITGIAQAPDKSFWFTGQHTLWHHTADGQWQAFDKENTPNVITYFAPKQIKFLPNGDFWLVFTDKLCLFDPEIADCKAKVGSIQLGLPLDAPDYIPHIDEIIFSEEAPVSYSTRYSGIVYFDGQKGITYQIEPPLSNLYSSQLYQDMAGTLWSIGGDIYQRTNAGWVQIEGLYGEHLATASDGTVWIGGGSFTLQSYQEGNITSHGLPLYYNDLVVTQDGAVYAGGFDGYSILDRNSADILTTVTAESHGWDMGYIQQMLYANETIYALTDQGVTTIAGTSWTRLIEDMSFTTMTALPDGTVLLGSDMGLYAYKDGALTPNSEIIEPVKAIFTTDNGYIWVVSSIAQNGYLHWFDGVAWQVRRLNRGFSLSGVRALHVEENNTIWVSFDGGLLHLKP